MPFPLITAEKQFCSYNRMVEKNSEKNMKRTVASSITPSVMKTNIVIMFVCSLVCLSTVYKFRCNGKEAKKGLEIIV